MSNFVIQLSKVTKKFYLQEDKTFKEFLPNFLLGKSWAKELTALDNLSFVIEKGETIGIIGKNGSGKSTLLKLMAGVTAPSSGEIKVSERVAPLIEVGAGFHHELTGYENIFLNAAILGMHKKEIEEVVDNIIDFSELREFIHVPVKRYSSGMYMRLGFAVAIHVNAQILLVDEVLAVGDSAFQKKCLDYLRGIKKDKDKTIVFVSHSEESVKSFCDRVILLDHGKIIKDGEPEIVFKTYHQILKI
ncbi:ABC transporter ATP-binding protein [Candidatus Daviesbacteria bacterium]|nr:ABC transporter ATP-binding protein [Candidatus Daviesbacteria bacterium]